MRSGRLRDHGDTVSVIGVRPLLAQFAKLHDSTALVIVGHPTGNLVSGDVGNEHDGTKVEACFSKHILAAGWASIAGKTPIRITPSGSLLRCSRCAGRRSQTGRRLPTVTIPQVSNGLNPRQVVSLVEETETAIKLLDEGIRVIAEWDGGEDGRIRGLFSMSQGFERLLKLTMTLILRGEGAPPPSAHFKQNKYRHRLLPLFDDILDKARANSDVMQRQALGEDIDFCGSDERLRDMLDILGEFGESGRYHNLDVILDDSSPADDSMRRWDALAVAILSEDPKWSQQMHADQALFSQSWYPHLAARQVGTLQRAARFLVRLWTLEPAQREGKKFKGSLRRFLNLADDQLASLPS